MGGTMTTGWHVDPSGRHFERLYDGAQWTGMVRNNGIEAYDPIDGGPVGGGPSSDRPAPQLASPGMLPPPTPSSSNAPPFATPYPQGPAPWSAAPPPRNGRRGLPWLLVVAIVLASFPAVLFFFGGLLGLMVGGELSDARDSSFYYEDRYFLDVAADEASETGGILFIVGGTALAFITLAGMGSNVGRVGTAIWLALSTLVILSQLEDMPDGAESFKLLMIAPPIIAFVGLFVPTSNELYRKT